MFLKLILATIARSRWSVCLVFVMVCIYIECRLRWNRFFVGILHRVIFFSSLFAVLMRWSESGECDLYAIELNACCDSLFICLAIGLGSNEPIQNTTVQQKICSSVAMQFLLSLCVVPVLIVFYNRLLLIFPMRHANEHQIAMIERQCTDEAEMYALCCVYRVVLSDWGFTLSSANHIYMSKRLYSILAPSSHIDAHIRATGANAMPMSDE